jgi:ubiquinone/menaquinone biosynthesis C-methylase UbiE
MSIGARMTILRMNNSISTINHHLLTTGLGGKLFLAPLDKPAKVLDVGTGTGIWAIDFADEFPESEVTGIYLSPIRRS